MARSVYLSDLPQQVAGTASISVSARWRPKPKQIPQFPRVHYERQPEGWHLPLALLLRSRRCWYPPSMARLVLSVYLALVAVAGVAAVIRLSNSGDMPGLDAIELVLLAMPWSLALGLDPMSRLGWAGMAGIVVGGIAVNALLVRSLAAWAQRHWERR